MRPLFDRDNRLAIIGGLAAAIPVRSKVTRQFRLRLHHRRPTYGLGDLSSWKLISSGRGFLLPNFIEISTKFLRDNPQEQQYCDKEEEEEGEEKDLLRFNSISKGGERFSSKISALSSSRFSSSFFRHPPPFLHPPGEFSHGSDVRKCIPDRTRKGRGSVKLPVNGGARITIRPLLIKVRINRNAPRGRNRISSAV